MAQLKVSEMISSLKLNAYTNRRPANEGLAFEPNKQKLIENILMKKLRTVSLNANQLYNAYLVILVRLFVSILLTCIYKNYCWTLYARIVDNPCIVDINPLTIGELVFAYILIIYLWVFM